MTFIEEFIKQHPLQKLKIDHTEGEYIVGGNGKEGFLIFPGGGQDALSCYDLVDAFEEKYKVIAVNISGFKKLDSFFEFVNQVLQKEEVDKIIVYGLSLGGFFAQHYAYHNPDKILKIVLSHTGSTKSSTMRKRVIIPGKVLYFFLPIIPLGLVKFVFRKFAGRVQSGTSRVKELYIRYSSLENLQRRTELGKRFKLSFLTKQYLRSFYNLFVDMEEEEDNWKISDLNQLSNKMLIIKTDNDPLARDDGIFEKYYPQAQVYTFHKTGHLTPFVQFEKMVKVIDNFLKLDKGAWNLKV